MPKPKLSLFLIILLVSILFTSCSVVESIFNAGMGFGIIVVLAVLVVIVAVYMKFFKKKM